MFCLQFEGIGPIERIRGLHHIKRWAENTLCVGGEGALSKNNTFFCTFNIILGTIFL